MQDQNDGIEETGCCTCHAPSVAEHGFVLQLDCLLWSICRYYQQYEFQPLCAVQRHAGHSAEHPPHVRIVLSPYVSLLVTRSSLADLPTHLSLCIC